MYAARTSPSQEVRPKYSAFSSVERRVGTQHAMRSPAFPLGSVFMSSAWAWITSAVPSLLISELLAIPELTFPRFTSAEVHILINGAAGGPPLASEGWGHTNVRSAHFTFPRSPP